MLRGRDMKQLFKITISEEYLDECLGYIAEHTKHCKTEEGNLVSEAFRSAEDPRVVYLISEWDTPEHEAAHAASEADAAFVRKMQGKEAEPVRHIEWTQLA